MKNTKNDAFSIGLSDAGLNHYYQRRVLLVYVLKIFNHPGTSLPQVKEVWGASKNVTREGEGGKAFLSTFTLVGGKGSQWQGGCLSNNSIRFFARTITIFFQPSLSFHDYFNNTKRK